MAYKTELRFFGESFIYQFWAAFVIVINLLMIWLAVYSFKTFLRLRGQKRLLVVDDQSITFPEYGDSLRIIRLSFSQIRDIYFGEVRHGQPGNLIIKYGIDGHAYIQRDALDKHDFDEICELIRLGVGFDEIEIR